MPHSKTPELKFENIAIAGYKIAASQRLWPAIRWVGQLHFLPFPTHPKGFRSMALTVGTTCYDGSRGHRLENLVARDDVREAIQKYFREEARDNALRKLERWISHSAESWIPQWRKGQNKSFATANDMVLWLQYKSEKVFQPQATREKELAELINDCPGIRRTVAQFISTHLVREFDFVQANLRAQISRKTGRYASFYSKIFFKRNLGEGLAYFRNQRNPSLSEMAAFLGDFALEARDFTKQCIIMTKGHDELRTNQAQVDAAVARAMQELERNREYRTLHRTLQELTTNPGPRLQDLERQVRDEFKSVAARLQSASSLDEIRREPKALKYFNEFKARGENRLEFGDDDARAFSSQKWGQYKQELIRNLNAQAASPGKIADKMLGVEINQSATRVTALTADAQANAKKGVRRINYNVAVNHQWTKFMMEKSAVVGAGPSSTTAVTLGLVNYCIGGDETRFAVAASLFAFWQRKKHLLRGFAAVHTWNEVMTALDNYLSPASGYAVPLDWGASEEMQCKVYEYPDSFTEVGLPLFSSNRTI